MWAIVTGLSFFSSIFCCCKELKNKFMKRQICVLIVLVFVSFFVWFFSHFFLSNIFVCHMKSIFFLFCECIWTFVSVVSVKIIFIVARGPLSVEVETCIGWQQLRGAACQLVERHIVEVLVGTLGFPLV